LNEKKTRMVRNENCDNFGVSEINTFWK